MSSLPADAQDAPELDLRGIPKPDKHPTIFAAYAALPVGGAFVLVENHDPRCLREQFDADHSRSYSWEYLNRAARNWRIEITKLARTPLPRVLIDTTTITAEITSPNISGAAWKLEAQERDLDSNIIALPPGQTIEAHTGPDLDVLIHILAGSGHLTTELDTIELRPGLLMWLPRRSRRQFVASPEGLRYLTVHQHKQGLVIGTSRATAPR